MMSRSIRILLAIGFVSLLLAPSAQAQMSAPRLHAALMRVAAAERAQIGQRRECEVVDFNQLSEAELIPTLTLFDGEVSLSLTAFRNQPAGAVSVTAYDTEMYDRDPNTALPEPPNSSHDDTQRFIRCNPAENGNTGECDGIVAMIPAPNFFLNSDTSGGGTLTISGFNGDWEIPRYDAVDSDNRGRDIILFVGEGQFQVGSSSGMGDGSVETVETATHMFTSEATFVFEGSGGIDDIELCRFIPNDGMVGDLVFEDEDADGLQCRDLNQNQICDPGEPLDPGIPDVKVNLTSLCDDPADDVDPGDPASMQRTDGTGFYKFMGLPIDCKYTVTVDPCNFDSGATCGDGDPGGALEGLVEAPPQIGPDECEDSGGVDDAGQPVGDMAMTRLPLDPPFSGDQNELNDPCLDFGYFPPPVEIEKFTNGHDADDADGFPTSDSGNFQVGENDIPLVAVGEQVVWSYDVTNPGPSTLVNVMVTDNQPGVTVSCPQDTLAPGETIRCMAMGVGLDLSATGGVDGCNAQGAGDPVPTYENVGTVDATVQGSNVDVTASDPSHYCNPPEIMVEKFTNGHDGDDASGSPAAGTGNFAVGGSTVAEIPEDGAITWTYRVTNTGTEDLVAVVVTDSKGVFVDCPQSTLAMGETIICTATGFADDLFGTGGDVDGCDAQGQGDPRPTYENLATVRGTGETSGVEVTDDDPSHYCNPPPPPPCGLMVEKGCELPPPPPPPAGKCDGKLQQFTMVWTGGPITVSGPANDAPGGQVGNGDEVTFFGPFSSNDVIVGLSGAQNGESTFHVSCSDGDMDGDTTTNDDQQQVSSFGRDCGKFEGNGKGSSGINDWLLEGFVDNSGATLDCTTDTGGPLASVCEFNAIPVSCETVDNPSNLTFVYTGGGCPGDNSQGSKSDCSGSINGGQPATVTLDGGTLGSVNPGESFIVPTTGSNTTIVLSNSGGTQTNDVHTSCSAPLVTGDEFGGLTLVGLDGQGLGTDVTYSYLVSNAGPDLVTNIFVTDDQLGDIGGISSLAPGDSATLTADAFISETTTNVATVDGDGPPGAVCLDQSSPVTVEILPPPPCDVGIVFEKLEDDKIKWKLTNNSVFGKATLQTFTLDFPSDLGVIKKVKLDGDTYKREDSNTFPNGVGSGETIGPDDWTQNDATKRELDQGETRTLEVEFTQKDTTATTSDFDLLLTFEEGCATTF